MYLLNTEWGIIAKGSLEIFARMELFNIYNRVNCRDLYDLVPGIELVAPLR